MMVKVVDIRAGKVKADIVKKRAATRLLCRSGSEGSSVERLVWGLSMSLCALLSKLMGSPMLSACAFVQPER